jgi:hypothetical protein
VFSDAALSTPLTNPVVASSSGILPQVFVAEGSTVDLQWLTSADVEISGRSYVDVDALGADAGDFTRTVTGSARFKITGSGGNVLLQVGDASPDDTGGTVTIEGWGGSQGDTITLDFAVINTTGRIKENSKKLPGVVYTEATTFTAVTSVDIPLTNSPTGVRAWDVDVFDFAQTNSTSIELRVSYDGGATFKSGAADYQYNIAYAGVTTGSTGDVSSRLANNNAVTPANQLGWARIHVIGPDTGSACTNIMSEMVHEDVTTSYPLYIRVATQAVGGYGRPTHIRLSPLAGTISGIYRVMPQRGFGET